MPIKDIWLRIYEKWSKKGADRSYAAWMADQAEKRYARKRQSWIEPDGTGNSMRDGKFHGEELGGS